MITFLNKIARSCREKNFFFKRFFDILTDYLWVDKMLVLKFDLETIDLTKKHEKTEIIWKLATEEDCEKWFQSKKDGFGTKEGQRMSDLIRNGGCFILGISDDAQASDKSSDIPVCYAACDFSKRLLHNKRFVVQSREGFIFNVFTSAENRGQGLAAGAITCLCREAKERSCSVLFIDISSANVASLRTSEKAGAVPSGSLYYQIRIFKKSFLWPLGPLKDRFVSR